jgi:uncharacterized protein (DUF305 family)
VNTKVWIVPVVTSILVLSACGQSEDTTALPTTSSSPSPTASESTNSATELNVDDAMWLAMMLAHHQQAVDMTDFTLEQTKNQEIRDLATAIRGAQYPEMEYMNGILYEGGYREPIDVENHLTHMQGMLTAEEMSALGSLSGAEFDKAFLESMIKHHEGAVSMSENMLVSGTNTQVKELAAKIIEAQNQEIVKMQVMLGLM